MISREQKLIDMMFEMTVGHKDFLQGRSRDQIAEWVAGQLRLAGFHTVPMGMSWGVLVPTPDYSHLGGIKLIEAERPE